jgi:hypothetical protein
LAGFLEKRGRQTNLWLKRYYVIDNGVLYQFQEKSDKVPKRKHNHFAKFT